MVRGAWQVTVHGVTKIWTWLKQLNLRYADDTTLMAESEEELKSLLMKVKEESEKVGLRIYFISNSFPKSEMLSFLN